MLSRGSRATQKNKISCWSTPTFARRESCVFFGKIEISCDSDVRVLQHHPNTIVCDSRFCTRRWWGGRFCGKLFFRRLLRKILRFFSSHLVFLATKNRRFRNWLNVGVRDWERVSHRKLPSELKPTTPTSCISRFSFLKMELRCQDAKWGSGVGVQGSAQTQRTTGPRTHKRITGLADAFCRAESLTCGRRALALGWN
jgi:hypothetical protein